MDCDRQTATRGDKDTGFLLTEVLVALAIAALLITVITPLLSLSRASARTNDARLALALAARAVSADLPARSALAPGTETGLVGSVTWQRTIEPIGGATADPTAWNLYRIIWTLSVPNGLTQRVETVRLGRRAV